MRGIQIQQQCCRKAPAEQDHICSKQSEGSVLLLDRTKKIAGQILRGTITDFRCNLQSLIRCVETNGVSCALLEHFTHIIIPPYLLDGDIIWDGTVEYKSKFHHVLSGIFIGNYEMPGRQWI